MASKQEGLPSPPTNHDMLEKLKASSLQETATSIAEICSYSEDDIKEIKRKLRHFKVQEQKLKKSKAREKGKKWKRDKVKKRKREKEKMWKREKWKREKVKKRKSEKVRKRKREKV